MSSSSIGKIIQKEGIMPPIQTDTSSYNKCDRPKWGDRGITVGHFYNLKLIEPKLHPTQLYEQQQEPNWLSVENKHHKITTVNFKYERRKKYIKRIEKELNREGGDGDHHHHHHHLGRSSNGNSNNKNAKNERRRDGTFIILKNNGTPCQKLDSLNDKEIILKFQTISPFVTIENFKHLTDDLKQLNRELSPVHIAMLLSNLKKDLNLEMTKDSEENCTHRDVATQTDSSHENQNETECNNKDHEILNEIKKILIKDFSRINIKTPTTNHNQPMKLNNLVKTKNQGTSKWEQNYQLIKLKTENKNNLKDENSSKKILHNVGTEIMPIDVDPSGRLFVNFQKTNSTIKETVRSVNSPSEKQVENEKRLTDRKNYHRLEKLNLKTTFNGNGLIVGA